MKEIIGKNQNLKTHLPKKFLIDRGTIIAKRIWKYSNFTTIGPDLASKILKLSKALETFMKGGKYSYTTRFSNSKWT